ncbi:MAG: hypothetical protein WAQ27_00450 [Candidatus Microsaccharimonas sp.]
MTHHEHIPDTFDIAGLSEPTEATLDQFNDVCLQLDGMGNVDAPSADPENGEVADFYTTQLVRQTFDNGTVISNFSFHGSDEMKEEWREMGSSTHTITAKTAEGVIYEYTVDKTGAKKLYVKKPGERVEREVKPVDSIDTRFGQGGLSMHITGKPELLRGMVAYMEERAEAHKLGLTIPTDASLKEFSGIIQSAIDSGTEIV